ERALGAPIDDPERAQDDRIVIPSNFKNARVLMDEDAERIVGFVVTSEPERSKEKEVAGEPRELLVRTSGDDFSVVTKDSEKLVATAKIPNLVFGRALRNPADGRDDFVAVTRTEDAQSRTWSLVAFRLHEGKLVRVIEAQPAELYKLTAANARWIGAELRDLELYLELTARTDSIEVGGLLTTRIGDKIRDIVVISPVPVPRRKTKPVPHEPNDAGTYDAASGSERAAE
ncbi:MAG TPA: hypothetical protein VFV99_11210, partial [Kofleriaceae bacterium]|nr:hypothetical protein [Kofleriaceae bacterium]